jgi:hypothetical protein
VSASSVQATFASLGATATSDVIELYAAIGGMENMDAEYWRHWPLPEIESENSVLSPFGILFADYLISSWCYRLKATSNETSCVYVDYFDGKEPTLVANSLREFIYSYGENRDFVHLPPSPRGDA